MTEIGCLWKGGALLGEGPVWREREGALYWVDIKGRFVHRLKLDTLETTSWSTPYPIGCIAPRRSGGWICAHAQGIAFLDLSLRGKVGFEPIVRPEAAKPGNRFNDGKCDAQGRFWAGSMDDAEKSDAGALYCVDAGLGVREMDQGFRVTNGPAFSPDGRTLYESDSARQTTFAYDLAPDGALSNKRIFKQFEAGEGYPDGMTADVEGNLWIAFWGAGRIGCYDKDGRALRSIAMPVSQPTSLSFGGPDYGRLFVTSAAIGLGAEALKAEPLAGGVFVLRPGAKGYPAHEFAG